MAMPLPLCVGVLFGEGQIRPIWAKGLTLGHIVRKFIGVMSLVEAKGNLAILVADSDVFARNLLIRELSRSGYFVLSAANCDEAIALSGNFPGKIRLFLSNSGLPGRKGLAERLVRERRDVRAIVISASTHAVLIEQSQARGALPDALQAEIRRAFTAEEFSEAAEV
jgi:CheY-like chemotaxis protein